MSTIEEERARAAKICNLCAAKPEMANQFISTGASIDEVTAAMEQHKNAANERVRASEINQMCATAHLNDLATDYIAGELSVDQIRAELFQKMTQQKDISNISTPLPAKEENPLVEAAQAHREQFLKTCVNPNTAVIV